MKKILGLLLIGIFVGNAFDAIASKNPSFEIDPELIGEYAIEGFNAGVTLTLMESGAFVHEVKHWFCTIGGGESRKISGIYEVREGILRLNPDKMVNTTYIDAEMSIFEKDSCDYNNRQDKTIHLKKTYQVLKWCSNVYLLSTEKFAAYGYKTDENDFDEFIRFYNSGYEPTTNGFYLTKRSEKETFKEKLNISTFPKSYQKLILKHPIIAEIIEVKEKNIKQENRIRYKINKGKLGGVYKNLVFYGDQGCCTIKITKANKTTCYGYIDGCYDYQAKCGQGARVTTFLERELGQNKTID